jgi:pyruvate dehydrogenase E2 component (dihydrolipoamide acetyltransferase)
MASAIHMPRLGWGMEEGTFGEWLKQDGDTVQTGDHLFTVEGDKATEEIESFDSGVLRLPPDAPKTGDTVTVGALLGYIVQPGEPAPFESQTHESQAALSLIAHPSIIHHPSASIGAQSKIENQKSEIAISPRARRVARELGVDWAQLDGSGATGRIIERDIRAAAQRPPESKLRVTPIAQRIAEERGIDLAELARQKASDKIERADVEAVIAERQSLAAPAGLAPEMQAGGETLPMSRIRRLIAQRMAESAHSTAPVTLTTEADATELVALREQWKVALATRNLAVPSYNDLLIKLCAVALQAHPLLNATWRADEIQRHEAVHIGLAVDHDEGLVVPVVHHAEQKSLRQIANETRDLIEKAQARRLSAEEMQDGTFTITNLGMYGIDAFTPIINLPQCAILGVGRILKKPAVVNDQIVSRQMMALSLTFDHRMVDGAPAARFLNTLRELIEVPALWLVG